jgi:hypothetical protein
MKNLQLHSIITKNQNIKIFDLFPKKARIHYIEYKYAKIEFLKSFKIINKTKEMFEYFNNHTLNLNDPLIQEY